MNVQIPQHVAERVLAKVVPGPDGCVMSTYSVASHGYAQIGWHGADGVRRMTTAHRAAWTGVHGPIPEGMTVHHRCHQRRCVNVEHLELLTNEQNARRNRDGLDWVRDGTCVNGHGREHYRPIDHVDGRRKNRCRACMADYQRAYRSRKTT